MIGGVFRRIHRAPFVVIDSSVVLAILLEEPTADAHARSIVNAKPRIMSLANFVEIGLRLVNLKGALGLAQLELYVQRAGIELVPVEIEQAREAVRAFEKYGNGRHPAALNFGDCLAYGLAKVRGEPLLYQGNDFSKTDLA